MGNEVLIAKTLRRALLVFCLLLIVLVFLALKSFSLHWEVGDENIYWYMAWAMAEDGAWFYRDFFFAHPPLHLLPGVILLKIFDFDLLLVRFLPVTAAALTGIFLYLGSRRSLGEVAGLCTAASYLFAYDVLRASSHWTGINLTVMWLSLGWYLLQKGKTPMAGLVFGAATGTGNYALPSVLAACGLALVVGRPAPFFIGLSGIWLAVQIFGLVLGGRDYLDSVWLYHLQKPQGSVADMFVRAFTDNFFLSLMALLGLWFGFWGKEKSETAKTWMERVRSFFNPGTVRGRVACMGLLVTVNLVFLSRLSRIFPFYFLLAFVWLAPLAGLGFQEAAGRLVKLFSGVARKQWPKGKRILAALVPILIVVLGYSVRAPLQNGLLPDYQRKVDRPMIWSDSPLLGPVNKAVRNLFFENPARAYQNYSTITEYLFHESQYFEAALQIAGFVASNTLEEERIFGDSSSAPLIALLAGRRLAAHEADTNAMRFRSGITRPEELIEKIEKDRLKLVVVSGREEHLPDGRVRYRFGGFGAVGEFRRWLEQKFVLAFKVRDRIKGEFFVFMRRQ